jgi:hypothetical protein
MKIRMYVRRGGGVFFCVPCDPESPSRTLGHAASVTINRAIRVDDQGNNAMINGGG